MNKLYDFLYQLCYILYTLVYSYMQQILLNMHLSYTVHISKSMRYNYSLLQAHNDF